MPAADDNAYTGKQGRPREYPLETIFRAMSLVVVRGVSYARAAEILAANSIPGTKSPSAGTIDSWSNQGFFTEGVRWTDARKWVETLDHKETIRHVRKEAMPYNQWVEAMKSDLETATDVLMNSLVNGEIELKASDLPNFAKTRQLLEGMATERVEAASQQLNIIGQIIHSACVYVANVYRTREVGDALDLLKDRIATEFDKFLTFGVLEPDHYEVSQPKPVGFLAESGDGRSEEA